jgi:hypothetical protein
MLKKVAVISFVALSLSACGHRQHWVAPAVVGGVVGYAIASSNSQPVVVQEQVIVQPSTRPDYSVCNQWSWQEREACFRGAENRARQEQARRVQKAYQQGYSGR